MLTGLASSWDGRLVAYADSGDGPVQVWDLQTYQLVSEFPTILQAGGSRLAISRDSTRVVAGAFRREGVAGYESSTGRCLWHAREITKIQEVGVDATGTDVWCVRDSGPAQFLDLERGIVAHGVPGVRWMCQSGAERQWLTFDGRRFRLMNGSPRLVEKAPEKGPLAGAFSSEVVCVSEVAGPLHCIEVKTGHEVQRVQPEAGCHWTEIGYVADLQAFAIVRYPFGHSQGGVFLQLFDPATARVSDIAELPSPKHVFCARGSLVLGSHGDLRRTRDGALVHHFGWFTGKQRPIVNR